MSAKVIGVTGPAGSGKSMVAQWFYEWGGRVIDADSIAHQALSFEEVKSKLVEVFGRGLLEKDIIARAALSALAFRDVESLKKLTDVLYPVITREVRNEIVELNAEGEEPIVLDAPTLFESGMEGLVDVVISVESPVEIREQRCRLERGWEPGETRRRDQFRVSEEERRNLSDFVVENSQDRETFRKEMFSLWKSLCGNITIRQVTHKKCVCMKCWRFHERVWNEECVRMWDEDSRVACPVDCFEIMKFKGKPVRMDKSMRNMFSAIYGVHRISDAVPEWCPFRDEHSEE